MSNDILPRTEVGKPRNRQIRPLSPNPDTRKRWACPCDDLWIALCVADVVGPVQNRRDKHSSIPAVFSNTLLAASGHGESISAAEIGKSAC